MSIRALFHTGEKLASLAYPFFPWAHPVSPTDQCHPSLAMGLWLSFQQSLWRPILLFPAVLSSVTTYQRNKLLLQKLIFPLINFFLPSHPCSHPQETLSLPPQPLSQPHKQLHRCSSEVLIYGFIRRPTPQIMLLLCLCVFTPSSILQISSSPGSAAVPTTSSDPSLLNKNSLSPWLFSWSYPQTPQSILHSFYSTQTEES